MSHRKLKIEFLEIRTLFSLSPSILELPIDYSSAEEIQNTSEAADPITCANSILLDNCDYVVVTNNALASGFQPLIEEKLNRGLTAAIVTTEYIYANYIGWENHDNADKIRDFLNDMYRNHDTKWVLLGGDTSVVPTRGVYVSANSTSYNNLPTDLYYSCLEGTWNGDGDNLWGEPNDGTGGGEIDFTAEVFVGRAPVSNSTEVMNFVVKTVLYDTTAHPNAQKALFVGDKLSVLSYGSGSCIAIRDDTLPVEWRSQLTELYDTPSYSFNAATLIDDLNASPNIVNHMGHGSVTINSRLNNVTAAGLTNSFPFFMYSQACSSGSFDTPDNIAKAYVASTHGAFAVVMNSREGWYDPFGGNDYSHHYAMAFWDAVFNQGKVHLGEANQASKDANLWRVGATGPYRWITFETNLLGDPETSFQLGNPITLPGVSITQSDGSTDVIEGGATDSYTVVLNSQPTANVTITLNPGNQLILDQTTLTFTPENWNVPQTVTVAAAVDHIAQGPHSSVISHQTTSSDLNYNGLIVDEVTVKITDVDTAAILITPPTGLATTENGGTAQFSVKLSSIPAADVTLGLASSNTAAGTVSIANLTFNPANWDLPQTITITGVDDYLANGDRTYQILFSVAASADGNYNGFQTPSINVTNLAYVAVTRTWTGNGVDDRWTTASNWLGGGVPHPTDSLVFSDGPQNQAYNDFPANTVFTSLTLQNNVVLTIGGNPLVLDPQERITLKSEGSGTTQIDLPLTIVSDGTFAIEAGAVQLAGALDFQDHTLTIANNSPQTCTIAGEIKGTGNLCKTGNADVVLDDSSRFSGNITVLAGKVVAATIVSPAANVTVRNGASLSVQSIIADSLTIGGTSAASSPANREASPASPFPRETTNAVVDANFPALNSSPAQERSLTASLHESPTDLLNAIFTPLVTSPLPSENRSLVGRMTEVEDLLKYVDYGEKSYPAGAPSPINQQPETILSQGVYSSAVEQISSNWAQERTKSIASDAFSETKTPPGEGRSLPLHEDFLQAFSLCDLFFAEHAKRSETSMKIHNLLAKEWPANLENLGKFKPE